MGSTEGGREVFAVTGNVGLGEARALQTEGLRAIAAGARVVDWSAVQRTDSAGLAVLLAWIRGAAEQGVKLEVRHLPSSLAQLARLYGVEALLPAEAFA